MNIKNDWKLKVSVFCYITFLLITIVSASTYLLSDEFMPYHASMIGQSWNDVNPSYQTLILGLMKAVGAGWLSVFIAASILLIMYFKHEIKWALWAIPAIGFPPVLVNLYIAINMSLNTPASPPWEIVAFNGTMLLVGLILSMASKA